MQLKMQKLTTSTSQCEPRFVLKGFDPMQFFGSSKTEPLYAYASGVFSCESSGSHTVG